MNITLFNPLVNFFGRTYLGKKLKLLENKQANELTYDDQDWVLFYTLIESIDTKAIIEFVVLEV